MNANDSPRTCGDEVSRLRKQILALEKQISEERDKRSMIERRLLQLASSGQTSPAMTSRFAHDWRQPLNIMALMIQNLQESWKYGEVDGTVINQTTEQIMDQIMCLSKIIDDCQDVPEKAAH